jgi:hypothetical protein
MKRRDLIQKLINNGWWKAREGDNHTIYTNGVNFSQVLQEGLKAHLGIKNEP